MLDQQVESIAVLDPSVHVVVSNRNPEESLSGSDAAERQEAEKRSDLSQLYRTLYETSRDAIMLARPEKGFLAGNPATLEMFECKDEKEFIGHAPADLSPEYQPDGSLSSVKAQEMMAIAMREGSHFFEWTHKRAGGAEFPATVLLTRMNLQGEAILQATVRDISKERRAEERIREYENRFRDIVDNSGAGVIFIDTDTATIFSGNQAMAVMLGRPQDELAGLSIFAMHPPEEFEQASREFREHVDGSRHISSGITLVRKDGSCIYVDIISTAVMLDGVRYLGVFYYDVTERTRAEKLLEREKVFSRAVFDSVPGMLYVYDDEGHPVRWNKKIEEITGYSHEELAAKSVLSWFRGNEVEHMITMIRKVMVEGWADTEATIYTKGDIPIPFYFTGVRLTFDGKLYLAGIGIDVTRRKAAEEALQRAHDELEQRVKDRTAQLAAKNEELKSFAYTVSHDLKAPLRGIAGYADELDRKHRDVLDQRGQFCIDQILAAARRQDMLIEDLLHYSRLDAETPLITKVNLCSLVDSILKERGITPDGHEVEVIVEMPSAVLETWEHGLVHVLTNLIDNALKYSRQASPPRITIRAEELSDAWRIAVGDNGVGFDMKYHDRIFGLFNRLVREEEFEGTGAGLAIVKKVLDKQGGRIWAESAPGQGATFFVELPKTPGKTKNT